jgi:hypothetical protein
VTDYITDAEFRAYIHDGSAFDPDAVGAAITAASRAVDAYCDRTFDDAGTVSARKFVPCSGYEVEVDDFSTVTGLIVATDTGYNETYGRTLTIGTDFRAEPVNQRRGGIAWPYDTLSAAGSAISYAYIFPVPIVGRPYTVRVTARWGWATVPEPVQQATKVMAAQYYKLGEAPFGVAGFGEYGSIRVRDNPIASNLLRPYARAAIAVA